MNWRSALSLRPESRYPGIHYQMVLNEGRYIDNEYVDVYLLQQDDLVLADLKLQVDIGLTTGRRSPGRPLGALVCLVSDSEGLR
jgi:hypothetical protein